MSHETASWTPPGRTTAGSTGFAVLLLVLLVFLAGSAPPARAEAPADPELRRELLQMMEADQAARREWQTGGPEAKVQEVDRAHGVRLRAVMESRGWPGHSLVGVDGAHAAWLLVQHQDGDVAFQRRCLDLLEAAVARQDASPLDLAYLTDRVLLAEGREQVYGTQFIVTPEGDFIPRPLQDPEGVEERRRRVGLPTMEEYERQLREMYRNR